MIGGRWVGRYVVGRSVGKRYAVFGSMVGSFNELQIVCCIKSRTRLFIIFSPIANFYKQFYQRLPYKVENSNALSNEQ